MACTIMSIPSQRLSVQFENSSFDITLDSGATVSYIKYDIASWLKLKIYPNNQLALLADQKTRMSSIGEIDIVVYVNNIQLHLRALVMQNLQAECFGGTTFHVDNGIEPNIKDGMMLLHSKYLVKQSNPQCRMPSFPPPAEKYSTTTSANVTSFQDPNCREIRSSKLNAISLPNLKVIFPFRCQVVISQVT